MWKKHLLAFLSGLSIILLLPSATQAAWLFSGDTRVQIQEEDYSYTVVANRDVDVKMEAVIWVKEDLLKLRRNFTIQFTPQEIWTKPSAQVKGWTVCEDFGLGGGPLSRSPFISPCVREAADASFRPQGIDPGQHRNYLLRVNITEPFPDLKPYVLRLEYTLPEHVLKQGNRYTVKMDHTNPQGKVQASLVLPSLDLIPEEPERATRIDEFVPGGNVSGFIMHFDGPGSRLIRYIDESEPRAEREEQRQFGTLGGHGWSHRRSTVFHTKQK